MNERVKFIAGYLQRDEPFSVLCARARISRKTGYKWVERYQLLGVAGLVDRSRAPISHPHAVPVTVVEKIVAVRRRHPHWGPRKLLVVLRRQEPTSVWPAVSTVGEILKHQGLVRRRRRRRYSAPYADRLADYAAPNAIWCADFKGHFPVADARCHPLTIMDGFSRYLLRCEALRRPMSVPVQKVFESTFREFGLLQTIRTDNGPPFSTLAPGGLSRLAVWWIRLGIRPERILPGRPEWYLSNCLAGELVGLEEMDGDRWAVYFGPIQLGLLDVQNAKERGSRSFGLLVRTDGEITSRRRRRRR